MESTGGQGPEIIPTSLKVLPHSTPHLKISVTEGCPEEEEGGYTDLNCGSKEDLGEPEDEGGYTDLNGGSKDEDEEGAYTDLNATMGEEDEDDAYSDVNFSGVKKEEDAYSEVNIRMGAEEKGYTGLCLAGSKRDHKRPAACSCLTKALGMMVLLLLSAVIAQSVLIFQHSKTSPEMSTQAILWTPSPISTVSQELVTEMATEMMTEMVTEMVSEKLYRNLSLTLETLKAFLCVEPESICQICPNSWKRSNGWCYYISNETQSWQFSDDYCLARHSSLLILDSEEDMSDILQKEQLSNYFWIGLTYNEDEVELEWLNGSPLNITSFTVNNRTNGSNCGALANSEIYVEQCHSQKKWICEKQAYQFDP